MNKRARLLQLFGTFQMFAICCVVFFVVYCIFNMSRLPVWYLFVYVVFVLSFFLLHQFQAFPNRAAYAFRSFHAIWLWFFPMRFCLRWVIWYCITVRITNFGVYMPFSLFFHYFWCVHKVQANCVWLKMLVAFLASFCMVRIFVVCVHSYTILI